MFLLLTPSLLSTRMIAESIYLFTSSSQTCYMIKNDTWARVMFSFPSTFNTYSKYVVLPRSVWGYEDMDLLAKYFNGPCHLHTRYRTWWPHYLLYILDESLDKKIMHVPPRTNGSDSNNHYFLSWSFSNGLDSDTFLISRLYDSLLFCSVYMFK